MDQSIEGIRLEIHAAEENRRAHMHRHKENVESYLGPAYWTGNKMDGDLVPGIYETAAVSLPGMAYSNPDVRVAGDSAVANNIQEDSGMSIAEEMTHVMKSWVKEVKVVEKARMAAIDFHLAHCCYLIVREKYEGYVPEGIGIDVYNPQLYRMNPLHIFWDAVADDKTEFRFFGHGYWAGSKKLLKMVEEEGSEMGWKVEVVKSLVAGNDGNTREAEHTNQTVRRDDIYIRQVWVPEGEAPLPEGANPKDYHGVIYWLGSSKDGESKGGSSMEFIRDPQPFYGPAEGPYVLAGGYPSAGGAFPLSTVVATRPLHDKVNGLARKIMEQAEAYKKGVAVPAEGSELTEIIQGFENTGFFSVNTDLMAKVSEFIVGGVDRASVDALTLFSEILDRMRGMDSSQMGSVDPRGTATGSLIAENSSKAIKGYLQTLFQDGLLEALRRVGWYFYSDPTAGRLIAMTFEAADGEFKDVWYLPRKNLPPYSVLDMNIELSSSQMGGDVTRRQAIMDAAAIIERFTVLATTYGPVADWDRITKAALETLNVGTLASTVNLNQQPGNPEAGAPTGPGGPPGGGGAPPVAPGSSGRAAGQIAAAQVGA